MYILRKSWLNFVTHSSQKKNIGENLTHSQWLWVNNSIRTDMPNLGKICPAPNPGNGDSFWVDLSPGSQSNSETFGLLEHGHTWEWCQIIFALQRLVTTHTVRTIKRLKLAMWMCATARFFPSPFLGSNRSMAEMPRNRSYRDRPSEVVSKGPALNIADVHVEWDADLSIRGRLRDGGTFLNDTKEKVEDIPTCIKNAEILLPLLNRMSGLEKRPVPAVEDLREEICKALTLSKRSSQEGCGHGCWHCITYQKVVWLCQNEVPSKWTKLCNLVAVHCQAYIPTICPHVLQVCSAKSYIEICCQYRSIISWIFI